MHSTGQCNRNEPGPLLYPTYKTYNRLKDVNVRLETIQLLEDNRCSKLPDIIPGNDFFGSDSKSKGNKNKNKQVGLHQAKILLHSKGNYQQNEKATY